MSLPSDVDVAIVGAGVSGLYTGYRLLTGDRDAGVAPPSSVAVFELSGRVGGRLESVVLPGMTTWGELGGMRYMPAQEIVTSLIEDVFKAELEHIPFPMGTEATHLFYLRKQRFRADSWEEAHRKPGRQPFVTRYDLNADDVGLSADQLFNKIVFEVLLADPDIKKQYGTKITNPKPYTYVFALTAQDWDAIKPVLRYCFPGPYKNELVNDLGFWNVIADQVSEEGYDFLADAGGYYSNTINWNAAEAFPYMVGDFSKADPGYRTIAGGYDQIATALEKAFLADERASLHLNSRLVRFDRATSGGRRYQLTLQDEQTGAVSVTLADALVLALPRRSLELLDQDNFLFQTRDEPSELARKVPTVVMEPSLKILMGFDEPWWKNEFGATAGESITDLPIRQCYYFGTDTGDTRSLLLAGYTDMDPVQFWEPLDGEQRFTPRPTATFSVEDLESVTSPTAPNAMVLEAVRQVRELHGRGPKEIPDPFVAWYRDWTDDPFGGGYHAWQPGISVRDVMQYMRRPDPAEAVHICGEAYSDQQGWVEGALCVAERMLQEHFGLKWPAWLDPTYYLGW